MEERKKGMKPLEMFKAAAANRADQLRDPDEEKRKALPSARFVGENASDLAAPPIPPLGPQGV